MEGEAARVSPGPPCTVVARGPPLRRKLRYKAVVGLKLVFTSSQQSALFRRLLAPSSHYPACRAPLAQARLTLPDDLGGRPLVMQLHGIFRAFPAHCHLMESIIQKISWTAINKLAAPRVLGPPRLVNCSVQAPCTHVH